MKARGRGSLRHASNGIVRDVRGATMAEYVVLVTVFGLAVAGALVVRGRAMLVDYTNARDLLMLPAN